MLGSVGGKGMMLVWSWMTYRLIDNAKSNLRIGLILHSQLTPQTRKLCVCWPALTNDLSIPSCIVVNINDAQFRTSAQAALNQAVVAGEVGAVQCTA